MSIEFELLNATRFKQDADAFDDRQDYLAALVKAADKLSADDFEELSDEATTWFNKSVKALNTKRPLPDFDPISGNDVDPEVTARIRKVTNAKLDEHETTSDRSIPATTEISPQEGTGDETQADEPQEKSLPKIAKPKIVNGELVKDRFGVVVGTKTAQAVALYNTPSGATIKEIDEKVGGRHMNILKKLVSQGHRVLKLGAGRIQLIHRDDSSK